MLDGGTPPPGYGSSLVTGYTISCDVEIVGPGNQVLGALHLGNGGTSIPPWNPGPGTPAAAATQARDPDCVETIADPVDVATGAYVLRKTLLQLPNLLPLDLELAYSTHFPVDRGLGFGWSQRFGMNLSVQGDLSVAVNWPNGRVTRYQPVAGGAYTVQYGDAQDVLTRSGNGSYILTDLLNRKFQFASNGELQSETQLVQGLVMTLAYAWSASKLQTVSDPVSGKQLAFAYDGAGRIAAVSTVENGATTATASLAYDANGNLITLTNALGKASQFTYDSNHRMLTGTNELGQKYLTNTFDTFGRVSTQVDGVSGPTSSFSYYQEIDGSFTTRHSDRLLKSQSHTYDPQWRLIRHKDELDKVTRYSYDAAGNRTSQTDALDRVTTFGYDARGNTTSVTDALGKTTTMAYNAADKLLSMTNPLAQAMSFQYGANGNLQALIDPLNQQTQYSFSGAYQAGINLVSSVTLPRGGVMQFMRNPENTAGSVTDATGNIINWIYDPVVRRRTEAYAVAPLETAVTTYDPYGRVLTHTDALGNTTTNGYDNRGRLLTVTDPRGGITTYAYDANDRVTSWKNALNQMTTYTYDAEDHLATVTDPEGRIFTYNYDARGALTRLDLAGQERMVSTYTATGPVATRQLGDNPTLSYGYDALDRVTSVSTALGKIAGTAYDDAGRVSVATDGLGRTTTFGYDAAGRLTSVTDALNNSAIQAFDNDGNRTGLTDTKGQSTAFAYDPMGRVTSSTTPDGSAVAVTYNGKGLVSSITNGRNQVTTYAYDAAHRRTQQSDPTGTISYTYDANGNQLTATDSTGTLTRTYDALNRISSQTDVYGNVIGYQYDPAGHLSLLTYPGGRQVAYIWSNANRLRSVTDWANRVTRYGYDLAGRLTSITNSNGKNASFGYDAAGQLISYSNGVNSLDYKLDASGNVVQESAATLAKPTILPVFTYDNANRLTSVNGQGVNHDADGNMLDVWSGSALIAAAYDSRNRLQSIGGASFVYDAESNRVATTTGTGTIRYIVNPVADLPQVLMETDDVGTPTAYYVYGLGLIGREDAAANYMTYHFDRRGSTAGLTNPAGVATDTYKYGPYGELVTHTGSSPQPFMYNGRDGVLTDASGLYHMRARYYSPLLLRFLQRDLLLGSPVHTPSLNRFAYVNGQPINFVDPFGLARDDAQRPTSRRVIAINAITRTLGENPVARFLGNFLQELARDAGPKLPNPTEPIYGPTPGLSGFNLDAAKEPLFKAATRATATTLAEGGVGNCKLNRQAAEAANLAFSAWNIAKDYQGLATKLSTPGRFRMDPKEVLKYGKLPAETIVLESGMDQYVSGLKSGRAVSGDR